MAIFYHGSSVLFKAFDLSHALEGDGKVKFGFGVYVTEKYTSAAHYAFNKSRAENKNFYVYTLEIPDMTEDNYIFSCKPVSESVIKRTEEKLGEPIPDEAKTLGKYFRKYVANKITGKTGTVKKMIASADLEAEKAATRFFDAIGLDFYVWPYSQTKPDGETNRAVLNDQKVKILKIEEVQLDDKKHQLIEGSQKEIKL